MARVLERVERILNLSLRGGDTAEQEEARALLALLEISSATRTAGAVRYARSTKKGGRK